MRAVTAPAPGKSTLPVNRRTLTQCGAGGGGVLKPKVKKKRCPRKETFQISPGI